MSPQGPQGPENGQGDLFLGMPFGTQICLHFCFQIQLFSSKTTVFKDQTLIKNGAQKGPKSHPKTHPKFRSIVDRLLASKMPPKASQNGASRRPKYICFLRAR